MTTKEWKAERDRFRDCVLLRIRQTKDGIFSNEETSDAITSWVDEMMDYDN